MRPRDVLPASLLAAALLVGTRAPARAQASLSVQGLGYSPGQVSTRAAGTGSAIAEIDPLSQLNPASLGAATSTTLFFQLEPEYRTVALGATRERTTIARYPLFAAMLPLGARWAVGISSATLLDRTFQTTAPDQITIGGDTVTRNVINGADGSINDLRFGVAYTPRNWLRVGFGGHLVTGNDRVFSGMSFDGSGGFAGFADTTLLSFGGTAASAGVQFLASRQAMLALSYRLGGRVSARRADTTIASARVPNRFGASFAYVGLAGTQIAARTAHETWTSLDGLSGGLSRAVDSWDSSIGADISGPHIGSALFMLRTGGRWRTLPYTANGERVRERSVSGGLGTTFANGRVVTDLAVTRALRDAGLTSSAGTLNERAWTVSIGVGVRP